MKRIVLIVFLLLNFFIHGKAQEKEQKLIIKPDFGFRTFWMNTTYPGKDFKKDYALGASLHLGGILTYKEMWKLHVGYRTFANLASSKIWEPDPITGQANRYETGLFDLLDTRDRLFGKLEIFSLEYSTQKFGVKAGRMAINSDWINAQDGRLSPTGVEGVTTWFAPNDRWRFSFWGIGQISVRGTSEWFSIGESVGIYPSGRAVSGLPANYFGNTTSSWVSIIEVDHKIGADSKIHFSNTLAQNLFSTYLLSVEKNKKMGVGMWTLGVQTGFQHGVGEGGNPQADLRYKEPSDRNFYISGRIGWKNPKWTTHLNYTHLGGEGRWLSPREWGKDAWYTFIPRERNEGNESMDAVMSYLEYRFEKASMSIYGFFGLHWLSEIDDPEANKYNFPSYRQINLGLKYQPKKLSDLNFHLILLNKEPLNARDLSPNQIYNKVEMLHFNGIINWSWH